MLGTEWCFSYEAGMMRCVKVTLLIGEYAVITKVGGISGYYQDDVNYFLVE